MASQCNYVQVKYEWDSVQFTTTPNEGEPGPLLISPEDEKRIGTQTYEVIYFIWLLHYTIFYVYKEEILKNWE